MKYKIYLYDTLESTNDKAKELIEDEDEGTVVIANNQTKGRGRLGREWISSKDKDILLSIILKPNLKPQEMQGIVLVASVAVNMALRDIGIISQIKWPNDIVIDGKKVCGILMEVCSSGGLTNHAILGIGINVNQDFEDIPEELKDKSTSLKIILNKEVDKDKLIRYLLNRFRDYYMNYNNKMHIDEILSIYKENSLVIGKDIYVIQGKKKIRKGRAIDIKRNGELVVRFPDGIEDIYSGDISIRSIDGYI